MGLIDNTYLKLLREDINFFPNLNLSGKKIYLFPDAPHLLKRFRDHTLYYGIRMPDGEGGWDILNKETVELNKRKDSIELKIFPTLTRFHLVARHNVSIAAQLLSVTVA